MANGKVVMEAEHFFAQEPNGSSASWTATADASASAGQSVALLPNTGQSWGSNVEATSPRIDYQVNLVSFLVQRAL